MTLETFLKHAPPPRPLEDGETYTVFLSYRSVDRPWVINLHDALSLAGHTVFLDQLRLVSGEGLGLSLLKGLKRSQTGVIIWSAQAASSKWVEREYEVMLERKMQRDGFHIVVVKLDRTPLPDLLDGVLTINFYNYPHGPNGGELLHLLHAVVGQPLSREALSFAEDLNAQAAQAANRITAAVEQGAHGRISKLMDEGGLIWDISPALGAQAVEALAKLGKDDAVVAARAHLAKFPDSLRPAQMLAHALSRRGAEGDLDEAQDILGTLHAAGHHDPETCGMYGRTFFDRYEQSGSRKFLKRARDLYVEGFEHSPDDTYCGINAASKSAELGDMDAARAYAADVTKRLPDAIKSDMSFWTAATIAEAAAFQHPADAVLALYAQAVDRGLFEEGSHRSAVAQAERNGKNLGWSEADLARLHAVFDLD
ncbi:MAG: toll/interleukin-1 receptor domain-containing protein, partial [Pseudomonadota bacterium]